MPKPDPAQGSAILEELVHMPAGLLSADARYMSRKVTPQLSNLNLDARIHAAKMYAATTGISAEMWLKRFGDHEVYEALVPEFGEPRQEDPSKIGYWNGFNFVLYAEPDSEDDIDESFSDFLDDDYLAKHCDPYETLSFDDRLDYFEQG